MNLEEAIKNRRSIRIFQEKKIKNQIIYDLIDAGRQAPSHCNTQAWRFILVDDKEKKKEIFDNGGSPVIKNAPQGILVLYKKNSSDNTEYSDWIQSSAAAIENILLKAHSLGLGACWVCHLPRKKILKKIFKIKYPYSPIAYIAIGYPQNKSISIPRKETLENIISHNTYDWPREKSDVKIITKKIFRKLYFFLPRWIKKIIFPVVDKHIKKFKN